MRNARLAFELEWKHPRKQSQEILRALRDLLDLEVEPQRIECFDISNIQGSDIVASMVVFEDGLPKKSDYRKFRVKSVSGAPDDFASMREVVGRRYKRLLEEGKDLPDLVLIDGGKGQLGAAVEALEELGLGDQPVASPRQARGADLRARPRRADRAAALLAGAAARPARARRGAPLRDRLPPPGALQAHARSELDDIPGVGPAKRRKLLSAFGSLRGVRGATEAELAAVVGKAIAARLRAHFEGTVKRVAPGARATGPLPPERLVPAGRGRGRASPWRSAASACLTRARSTRTTPPAPAAACGSNSSGARRGGRPP